MFKGLINRFVQLFPLRGREGEEQELGLPSPFTSSRENPETLDAGIGRSFPNKSCPLGSLFIFRQLAAQFFEGPVPRVVPRAKIVPVDCGHAEAIMAFSAASRSA